MDKGKNQKLVAMQTVWAIASWTFTGTFASLLLMVALEELLPGTMGHQFVRVAAWAWLGAAGGASLTGWYAILWRPIPNNPWNTFVFLLANVVVVGNILLLLSGGFGMGSGIVG